MKRIVLFFCVLIITCSAAMAQNATPANNTSATKSSFVYRSNELDAALTHNDQATAKSVFEEIKKAMQTHMGETKTTMVHATSNDEKQTAMTLLKKQQIAYADLMKLSTDLTANRQAVNEKLKAFSEAY